MKWDERTTQISGQSAMIMLGLTQVALGVILMVRLYWFDQPDAEVRDIQWVLFGSIIGYFTLRSFLGGVMPVPTAKQALIAYITLFSGLFIILALWLGLPPLAEWRTSYLPAALGPAIIVVGYWVIAAAGKRWVERSLDFSD